MLAVILCGILLTNCVTSSNNGANGSLAFNDANAVKGQASYNPQSDGYKIGQLDVLDISVFKVPDLTRSVQVAATGTVNLPLVGEVPVAGLTAQEVERELTKRLGAKYLKNPQVTVYVKEYNSQQVTIEGAVKKPGLYPVKSKTSLLQLIALSGGLESKAESTVLVMRNQNGQRSAARFDLNQIRSGAGPDPALQSGDIVVVGTDAIKEAFEGVLKALPLLGAFALL